MNASLYFCVYITSLKRIWRSRHTLQTIYVDVKTVFGMQAYIRGWRFKGNGVFTFVSRRARVASDI